MVATRNGRAGVACNNVGGSDRERLCAALAERGGGSVLRGWRRELDTDGSLDVGFQDFCKATSRLNIALDCPALFGGDSPDSLSLDEVAPEEGRLVNRFRVWLTEQFGGPGEMFLNLEQPESEGTLTRRVFADGCGRLGFEGSFRELVEIYNLLDVEDQGFVAVEDVMFLELDTKRRQGAILKAKLRPKREYENLLVQVYKENMGRGLARTHRSAPREWHAASLERLPGLSHEKKALWVRAEHQRVTKAQTMFMQHLHNTYGNGVRAWRRGLDPGCRFEMTKADLGRYIRRNNLQIDLAHLWRALDQNGDGIICMEELGPEPACALARFHVWAKSTFGSCSASWPYLRSSSEAIAPSAADSWRSDKKILVSVLVRVLARLRCPDLSPSAGVGQTPDFTLLCNALDLYGCGFISQTDLEWLDQWDAPAWLSVGPDQTAWADLKALMLHACGKPLRAWRKLLDTDDSNQVTWSEFQDACRRVKFHGNAGGAWRCLDDDLSGSITLQEFDPTTATVLSSFKAWIDEHWGAVEYAFKTMDTDGSGALTFSELKRACKQFQWDGDVNLIFDFLDVDVCPGKRNLSFKELVFLDSWHNESVSKDDPLLLPAHVQTPVSPSAARQRTRSSPTPSSMMRTKSCPSPQLPQLASPVVTKPAHAVVPKVSKVEIPKVRSRLPSYRERSRGSFSKRCRCASDTALEIISGRVVALASAPA